MCTTCKKKVRSRESGCLCYDDIPSEEEDELTDEILLTSHYTQKKDGDDGDDTDASEK
jgi:hypothetical protein